VAEEREFFWRIRYWGAAAAVTEALEALAGDADAGIAGWGEVSAERDRRGQAAHVLQGAWEAGEIEVFDKLDTSRGGWEEGAGSDDREPPGPARGCG